MLFPIGLRAQQPAEFADQREPNTVYLRVAAAGPTQWVFAGITGFGESQSFLSARNDEGQQLWDIDLDVAGQNIETRDLTALIDGFIATGPVLFCDVMPEIVSGIVRTDMTGQTIWEYELDTMLASSMSVRSDGLLAFGDDPTATVPHLLVLNADGTEHAYWVANDPSPRTIGWDVDNSLLVLFASHLVRYTDMSVELNAASIPPGALDLAITGTDSAYVLYADRIVRYVNGLTALDSVDLVGWSTARWMEHKDGKLWVTCSEHVVAVDLGDHTTTGFATEQLAGHSVSGTAISNGLIMTAGTASINERSAGVARSYTTAGAVAQHDLDVAIHLHTVDSSRIDTLGPENELVRFHLWATIRLENLGMEPVTKALLNFHVYNAICGWNDNSAHPDSFLLSPGESILLTAPEAISNILYCPIGSEVNQPFCFVAISPNDRVDREPTNNEACTWLSYSNTTAIIEHSEPEIWTVSPQPFADGFTIQLSSALSHNGYLAVTDATGRDVHRQSFDAGVRSIDVRTPALSSGTYLLRVEMNGFRSARHIVKLP